MRRHLVCPGPLLSLRVSCLLALSLAVMGCAESPKRPKSLRVLLASSLGSLLDPALLACRPEGFELLTEYAGSQAHRARIEGGGPGHVFISANEAQVRSLGSRARGVRAIAEGELVVVTPLGDERVASIEDLSSAERIVLARAEVPAGVYAAEMLRRVESRVPGFEAAVRAHVVSEEPNVRLALAKVELHEADAAIVYRGDAIGREVRVVSLADELTPTVRYFAAAIDEEREPAADALVRCLGSARASAHFDGEALKAPRASSVP